MPDLLCCLAQYGYYVNDGAAAPSAPGTALIPFGMPDTTDVASIPMVKNGAIVGLIISSAPSAGDTITGQVMKNGVAVAGLTLTVTNAQKQATAIFSKDVLANQFNTGDLLSVNYTTTTGGTYTVHDIYATVIIQYGLSE